MKAMCLVLFFSAASFISGMAVSSAWHNRSALARTQDNSRPAVAAQELTPTRFPTQTQDAEEEFPKLSDDRYITKFNGTKLKLNYGSWAPPADLPAYINEAKIIPLKTGGLLINLEDTLYRLDAGYQVAWKYEEAQPIFDFSVVESTGLIYGTAGDNVMFILNAANGKKLHRDARNGSASYGVAQNYGGDMCLVTDDNEIYREKAREVKPMNDGITCWRGEEGVWSQDFPPGAQLAVNGNRILAVTKTRSSIYVQEIKVPQKSK
ncbi:MAG TPA: hypothetical protein VK363_11335 [Pyrinomonadaceae bacterium]|nr:hypothetical protein [Pyrinomonadaceae bacterium]